MADRDAFALGQSDLNRFLFAEIGVENSGMPLSVVSALARLDLDPWQEAGRLAKLPRPIAANELARVIAGLPTGLWPMSDATPIAVRLVALLPGQCATPVLASRPITPERGTLLVVAVITMAILAAIATHKPATVKPASCVAASLEPAPANRIQVSPNQP